jgi:hypothetical protein
MPLEIPAFQHTLATDHGIPASGTPRKLVHAIEPSVLDALPGEKTAYAGRGALEESVGGLLRIARRIYSKTFGVRNVNRMSRFAVYLEGESQRG